MTTIFEDFLDKFGRCTVH